MQKIPKRFEAVKLMPPLSHNPSGNYRPENSEVISWLISRPEILEYIFDAVRGNGRRESPIIYNSDTGTWQGVDCNEN